MHLTDLLTPVALALAKKVGHLPTRNIDQVMNSIFSKRQRPLKRILPMELCRVYVH